VVQRKNFKLMLDQGFARKRHEVIAAMATFEPYQMGMFFCVTNFHRIGDPIAGASNGDFHTVWLRHCQFWGHRSHRQN
jgi:hypothetical protein